MIINKEHKDRLFVMLFGREEYKENILSLYNALMGTDYSNESDIRIYTIEEIIYIEMKNDVALIFDSRLSLWEHQSSYNPNMPLRGLMYFGKMYDKYVTENRLNIYGRTLIKIPTPSYIVFYNGTEDTEPIVDLKLSDAFVTPGTAGRFEWTDIMKIFLLAHRAEVMDMCLTEFDEEAFVNGIREEGREEGRETLLFEMVHDGEISPERAASRMETSVDVFTTAYELWLSKA